MFNENNLNIGADISEMDLYRQKLFAHYEEDFRAAQPVLAAKRLRIMLCGCDKENYPSGLQCSCNFGEYEQFSLEELQVMYAEKLKNEDKEKCGQIERISNIGGQDDKA